ncbi:uncharacterized protein BP5553_05753 [Venustampulla echinocandica]|uniref:Histidine kinase domain-containing protein n=1 Tax=Venustampulla echinocandica TaxID=2656787 RepID=A0A370TLK5_9HELO|nr:uncharacterized protein BP5553_05753 [Venustampulla echinocandica]RDL36401.1 hypothetical protein BP5553_05753 [Venustampulla echinocandica]
MDFGEWAGVVGERTEEKDDQAIEMKNQQERFVDITCKEELAKPPLVAYAEATLQSESVCRDGANPANSQIERTRNFQLLDEAADTANTIICCVMHQNRIIDDILTLSRLDSNLLPISPEPAQPIQLIRNVLKMFDAEFKRAETKLDVIEQASLIGPKVDWTLLDPSRVLQILINLMTNATTFTRTQAQGRLASSFAGAMSAGTGFPHLVVEDNLVN